MPRRILKSRIPRNRDKYSVEQTGLNFTLPTGDPVNGLFQQGVLIVPSSSTQGMRKVKHLTVNLAVAGSYDVFWALVFVPEGYNPNALFPAGSVNGNPMYEPNQYVMNCGICDPDSGPARFSSRISRNLNSGDRLYLIIGCSYPNVPVQGVVRYAVTLQ